jgi:metallo-beta-lactamase family protein
LPKLVRDGFSGKVYATPPTRDAAEFLLADSDHLLAMEAERTHRPVLYNHNDIMRLMSLWQGVPYREPVSIGPFTVTFYNAAHVLGSSSILVEAEGKRVLFSGDLGNVPAPLLGSWDERPACDTLLIESTYGARAHEDLPRRKKILTEVVAETVSRGGTLMIPAFAMERTQELLFELSELIQKQRIPAVPIFLDSPLAIKLTGVYREHDAYLAHDSGFTPGSDPRHLFSFPTLTETERKEDSIKINDVPQPKIIIAGSGMMHGGRILHHAKRYLSDEKSTLLIVGYQAQGSYGRQILDGAPTVKMFGEKIPVRARVKAIGGYSAHADQPQLLAWMRPIAGGLARVFAVQGEEDQSVALAGKIREAYGIDASVPSEGDVETL